MLALAACAGSPTNVLGHLALGSGSMQHETRGTALDDRSDAEYFALGMDILDADDFGGGFEISAAQSDDDMFVHTPVATRSEAGEGELSFHVTKILRGDRGQLPLRVGVFFRNHCLDFVDVGESLEWSSFGAKADIRPSLDLMQSGTLTWLLTGRLAVGFGATTIETDPDTEEWDTEVLMADLGIGTGLRFQQGTIELGYLLRMADYDESDARGGTTIRAADTEFSGIVLTGTLRF
jgi:hypothetical protein